MPAHDPTLSSVVLYLGTTCTLFCAGTGRLKLQPARSSPVPSPPHTPSSLWPRRWPVAVHPLRERDGPGEWAGCAAGGCRWLPSLRLWAEPTEWGDISLLVTPFERTLDLRWFSSYTSSSRPCYSTDTQSTQHFPSPSLLAIVVNGCATVLFPRARAIYTVAPSSRGRAAIPRSLSVRGLWIATRPLRPHAHKNARRCRSLLRRIS